MSDLSLDSTRLAELRGRAASRLTGDAAGKGPLHRMTDALASLHALASAPETAPDALALLHELQVHQVELDLQAQELQDSRAELELALRRQTELYDAQPVACFTTDRRLVVLESNRAAADLLAASRDEIAGMNLGLSFPAADRRTLEGLVTQAVAGQAQRAPTLRFCPAGVAARDVRVSLRCDADGDRCFIVLTEIPGDADGRTPA